MEEEHLSSLKSFKIRQTLDEYPDTKRLIVEGRLGQDEENPAVLILEKMPFNKDKAQELLQTSSLKTEFKNDIYGKYECFVGEPAMNSLKANLIYPATEKHIAKYKSSQAFIVNETPALYQTVTLPHIQKESFTADWVYNILDHKKESERIVYEDPDAENGFILLPDFKWSCKQVDDLYLVGLVHTRKLKSLRDLNHRHLPLLRKLLFDGSKAIFEKYGVHSSQLRIYLHYQPSYYHLHVHYTHLKYQDGGIHAERAHLLSNIIKNIERQPNFYEQATLPFVLKERDNLFSAYKGAGFDFGPDHSISKTKPGLEQLFDFFHSMGKAKHEPCGEHWEITYGESAWRLAIMALCLSPDFDRKRLCKMALVSAFTRYT